MMRTARDSTQRREGAESQGFQATSLRLISCSCRRPCKSSTGRPRSGYILVFFAMILFGIMALAALVIDIGFARLTQRQMQTAVDAAAIDGLRFRDGIPDALVDQHEAELIAACGTAGTDDPTWRNCARRWFASKRVGDLFDDDLNSTAGDPLNFGAGPILNLSGGVGDTSLNASQLLSVSATPVYKPQHSDGQAGLELNVGNSIYGDMVAGAYDSGAAHDDEDGDYIRSDFPTPMPNENAFLVRMRRSNNFDGVDEENGVSTHGPTIPYLFGRGSFLTPADPSVGYSPRHHGMTVRATGIADAFPAMSVGIPVPTEGIAGSLEMAVELTQFTEWDGIQPIPATECFQSTSRVIGDQVSNAPSTVAGRAGFIGLFHDFGDATTQDRRIVAFGFGSVDLSGNVRPDRSRLIFAENVSGVAVWNIDPNAPISQIMAQRSGLRGEPGIVHSPISAR